MAFSSSPRHGASSARSRGSPLYEVILESDLAESGLTRAESEAEMHRLWSVMRSHQRRLLRGRPLDERLCRAAMRPR